VRFAALTLCIASQRVFIVVSVYFVIDSVRKLLDTPSYIFLFVLRGSFVIGCLIQKFLSDKCFPFFLLKLMSDIFAMNFLFSDFSPVPNLSIFRDGLW
jgi:hypothetical protein